MKWPDTRQGHEVEAAGGAFDDDRPFAERHLESAAGDPRLRLWRAHEAQIDTLPGRRRLAWNWAAAHRIGRSSTAATSGTFARADADTPPPASVDRVGWSGVVSR